MKIGVMLRGVDKQGGTGVYARNLLPYLFELGSGHSWRLIYQSEDQRNFFDVPAGGEQAVLTAKSAVYWDQVLVPRYAQRDNLDVIFNTKFTLPLRPLPGVSRVMALHGASWYVIPECYDWWDVWQIRLLMPLYCRTADFLVSNSECTTKDYIQLVGADPQKIVTIPLAPAEDFRRIESRDLLEDVREKYALPKRFVLSVAAYDPRKNVPRLMEAFAASDIPEEVHLVVVGRDCERYKSELPGLAQQLGERLFFPGWVEQEDLPAFYNLAEVFLFPSLYEEFGIPNCEAMACGTPIITAETGAPPTIVGDAGILVDPLDIEEMAGALEQVVRDASLKKRLSVAAIERSKDYSWRRTASRTLDVIEAAGERQ